MKKSLFQYAVLLHEYDKEGNYTDTKVIIEPKIGLGKSEKDLLFKITRDIPEEHTSNPDSIEIIIRGF